MQYHDNPDSDDRNRHKEDVVVVPPPLHRASLFPAVICEMKVYLVISFTRTCNRDQFSPFRQEEFFPLPLFRQRWRVGCCLEDVVGRDGAALSVLISASGNCTMSATLPTLSSRPRCP
jgi:hypothetical protein